MKTLLSKNSFSVDPNVFGAVVQQNLDRAKSLQADAWSKFSNMVPSSSSQELAFGQDSEDPTRPRARSDDPQYNDNFSSAGFADNVPRSLIHTESGGRWGARNSETGSGGKKGHYGILQFGHARLDDARRAGAIPKNMTAEQFTNSRKAQIAAANWHFQDIDNRIRKAGFDRYVGQEINGTPITWDGMRAMAHLGGFGGLSKFINSRGRYNPSDSFGTSLSAYGRTHSQY